MSFREELGGISYLIERLGLPPRMTLLVKEMETVRPLTDPDPIGEAEVSHLLGMVDGPMLIAAIMAAIISHVPLTEVEEPEAQQDGDDPDSPSGTEAGSDGSPAAEAQSEAATEGPTAPSEAQEPASPDADDGAVTPKPKSKSSRRSA